jgi:glycosyltransferase involved in cell wall biosynthesis
MIRVSVIVPAYNAARTIGACLEAIRASADEPAEIIVVDDGSTDQTPELARRHGAAVLQQRRQGPAAARNCGATAASGAILAFVDSDVIVHPGAIGRMAAALQADPALNAVFGSYDASPQAGGAVSRYRNLLHAYTHQTGDRRASTFWAGLGAVRRNDFERIGGFNAQRFETASIEDIEFGLRLIAAGGRIGLDPSVQGTHCKRWTLSSMLKTDLWCRAVPWTRLLRQTGKFPNDLNLRWSQRLSVCLAWLAPPAIAAAFYDLRSLAAAAGLLLLHLALNAGFLHFVRRHAGLRVAAASVPLHLLFHWVAGLGFLIGNLSLSAGQAPAISPRGAART